MKTIVRTRTTYHCSLEEAFKAPLLCDVTKVHTGYGFMPALSHCEDDSNWGIENATKKVFAKKSLFSKGGYVSMDKILTRIENSYWKFEIYDFQSWFISFYKFTAEWKVTELSANNIQIDYTCTLHSKSILMYPINWLFAKLFWKKYMLHVLENVEDLILVREPYLYN